ncbi:hypothetical protein KIPB_006074, partial [Kipferlia bialata]|eukprot:g6074.t1
MSNPSDITLPIPNLAAAENASLRTLSASVTAVKTQNDSLTAIAWHQAAEIVRLRKQVSLLIDDRVPPGDVTYRCNVVIPPLAGLEEAVCGPRDAACRSRQMMNAALPPISHLKVSSKNLAVARERLMQARMCLKGMRAPKVVPPAVGEVRYKAPLTEEYVAHLASTPRAPLCTMSHFLARLNTQQGESMRLAFLGALRPRDLLSLAQVSRTAAAVFDREEVWRYGLLRHFRNLKLTSGSPGVMQLRDGPPTIENPIPLPNSSNDCISASLIECPVPTLRAAKGECVPRPSTQALPPTSAPPALPEGSVAQSVPSVPSEAPHTLVDPSAALVTSSSAPQASALDQAPPEPMAKRGGDVDMAPQQAQPQTPHDPNEWFTAYQRKWDLTTRLQGKRGPVEVASFATPTVLGAFVVVPPHPVTHHEIGGFEANTVIAGCFDGNIRQYSLPSSSRTPPVLPPTLDIAT